MITKAYACYSKDEVTRLQSSSGGIYSLLAEKIIKEGGVVYAACYDEDLEVSHCRIDKLDDIAKSRGSKYVASHLGTTFCEIRELLNKGKKVLFVGTPCQCAGLLSFIDKGNDNLICVDFICHGIPGRTAWREYKKSLIKRGMELKSVNMRDKNSGWSKVNYSWKLESKTSQFIYQHNNHNPFMKGFIADLFLRPSCYQCRFKGIKRNTDFTLGDYWGVWDLEPDMDDNKGTSLLFVHTEKGMELFLEITNQIAYKETEINKAVERNKSVIKSALMHKGFDSYHKRIKNGEDFISIIEDMTKVTFIHRIKRKVKRILQI